MYYESSVKELNKNHTTFR